MLCLQVAPSTFKPGRIDHVVNSNIFLKNFRQINADRLVFNTRCYLDETVRHIATPKKYLFLVPIQNMTYEMKEKPLCLQFGGKKSVKLKIKGIMAIRRFKI